MPNKITWRRSLYWWRLHVLCRVFQLWRQSSGQLLPRRWLLVVFDWTSEKCNSYRNSKVPVRPINNENNFCYVYVIFHFDFLECIKIGENLRQHPFSVARPLLSPDQLTHPFTLQQDQLTIQKQPDLHTIKKQPRGPHIMPELRREVEVLEMMMISALVMTTTTMASLENDDVIDIITDFIDKTENKVICLKSTILYFFFFNP